MNFNNEAARLNHIDTIFLISKNKIINRFSRSDTVDYIVYDSLGNIIRREWNEIMGTSVEFIYFNSTFPTLKRHITDADYEFQLHYDFNPSISRLYQIWTVPQRKDGTHFDFADTCWFDFNSKGQMTASKSPTIKSISPSRKFYETFSYNHAGQIITRTSLDTSVNMPQLKFDAYEPLSHKMLTNYYYTNNQLDSSSTEYFNGQASKIAKSTTYYSLGLPIQTILCDTIKILYAWKKGSS